MAELELAERVEAHKKGGQDKEEGEAAQRKADVFAEGGVVRRVAWEKEGETWKKVRLLSCADFDTEITFNPNKVGLHVYCALRLDV